MPRTAYSVDDYASTDSARLTKYSIYFYCAVELLVLASNATFLCFFDVILNDFFMCSIIVFYILSGLACLVEFCLPASVSILTRLFHKALQATALFVVYLLTSRLVTHAVPLLLIEIVYLTHSAMRKELTFPGNLFVRCSRNSKEEEEREMEMQMAWMMEQRNSYIHFAQPTFDEEEIFGYTLTRQLSIIFEEDIEDLELDLESEDVGQRGSCATIDTCATFIV